MFGLHILIKLKASLRNACTESGCEQACSLCGGRDGLMTQRN